MVKLIKVDNKKSKADDVVAIELFTTELCQIELSLMNAANSASNTETKKLLKKLQIEISTVLDKALDVK